MPDCKTCANYKAGGYEHELKLKILRRMREVLDYANFCGSIACNECPLDDMEEPCPRHGMQGTIQTEITRMEG